INRYCQIARAASTRSRSFARWSASVSGLRPALLAKPHCGLTASRSSSICFAVSSMRRRKLSTDSSAGVLLLMIPSTTPFAFGTKRSGVKSPARGVSYSSRKWFALTRAKKRSATQVVPALGEMAAPEIAGAHVNADDDLPGAGLHRTIDRVGVALDQRL